MNPINPNLSFKGLFVFSDDDFKKKNIRLIDERKPQENLYNILKDAKCRQTTVPPEELDQYPNLPRELNGTLRIIACIKKPNSNSSKKISDIDKEIIDVITKDSDMTLFYTSYDALPAESDFKKYFNAAFLENYKIKPKSQQDAENANREEEIIKRQKSYTPAELRKLKEKTDKMVKLWADADDSDGNANNRASSKEAAKRPRFTDAEEQNIANQRKAAGNNTPANPHRFTDKQVNNPETPPEDGWTGGNIIDLTKFLKNKK